jgi:hypothetical protein
MIYPNLKCAKSADALKVKKKLPGLLSSSSLAFRMLTRMSSSACLTNLKHLTILFQKLELEIEIELNLCSTTKFDQIHIYGHLQIWSQWNNI